MNQKSPHPDLDFVLIEGGEFMMGGEQYNDEKPIHRVHVPDFNMCKYPVTQKLYEWVMNENPSRFKGKRRPVENVTWYDAQEFIKALNAKTGNTDSNRYRLPTEAEWEYAARGGRYSKQCAYAYSGSDKLSQVGWYKDNSGNKTKEVGLLLSNELGLYDMSGNVWEWCEDRYSDKYYDQCKKLGVIDNPKGPDKGTYRVIRGAGYFNEAVDCRSSLRNWNQPDHRYANIGFRLVSSLQSVG